eukprot:TRINITY_DN70812_c0_g1_i1.p1 TRINITY_DN70812_c0_g1~~TRINITY_DN70812_c0_g1_i1.p1  ORF type:complete len:285 (+),score=0.91 TRINITY_DN70812_c0_g1_i1:34-888(+)
MFVLLLCALFVSCCFTQSDDCLTNVLQTPEVTAFFNTCPVIRNCLGHDEENTPETVCAAQCWISFNQLRNTDCFRTQLTIARGSCEAAYLNLFELWKGLAAVNVTKMQKCFEKENRALACSSPVAAVEWVSDFCEPGNNYQKDKTWTGVVIGACGMAVLFVFYCGLIFYYCCYPGKARRQRGLLTLWDYYQVKDGRGISQLSPGPYVHHSPPHDPIPPAVPPASPDYPESGFPQPSLLQTPTQIPHPTAQPSLAYTTVPLHPSSPPYSPVPLVANGGDPTSTPW